MKITLTLTVAWCISLCAQGAQQVCKNCAAADRAGLRNQMGSYASNCSDDPNYYRGFLQFHFGEEVKRLPQSSEEVSTDCIHTAQKAQGKRQHYKACTDEHDPIWDSRNVLAPCLSRDYAQLTSYHYNKITRCLGLSAKEMTGMLSYESGFHVNTVSETGAAGVGQLTESAIKDVNRSLHSSVNLSQYVSSGECAGYNKFIQPPSATRAAERLQALQVALSRQAKKQGVKQRSPRRDELASIYNDPFSWLMSSRCEGTFVPGNPERNILYTAMFYKLNQYYVDTRWGAVGGELDRLLANVNTTHKERLRILMTQLGHNMSASSAMNYLVRYLRALPVSISDSSFNCAFDFSSPPKAGGPRFIDFLTTHFTTKLPARLQSKRRHEVVFYMHQIYKVVKEIESSQGPGVCQEINLYFEGCTK